MAFEPKMCRGGIPSGIGMGYVIRAMPFAGTCIYANVSTRQIGADWLNVHVTVARRPDTVDEHYQAFLDNIKQYMLSLGLTQQPLRRDDTVTFRFRKPLSSGQV